MPRPRLRDVAELAGTSTAVVSYVINDGPRPVSPDTRRRVEAAIEQLGYRPNAVARGLRRQQTGTYGLVVPDLTKSFFAELAASVERAASASGRRLLVGSAQFSPARELEQVRAMVDAQVDGVIVAPSDATHDPDALLRRAGVPWVLLHRYLADTKTEQVRSVVADDHQAGRAAVEHLLGHGHTRIACLGGSGAGTPVHHRMDGYRDAMAATTGSVPEDLVAVCSYDDLAPAAYRATRALLTEHPDMTAVFAATDEHALGVYRAASEAGRRLGHDLALVSVDGTAWSAFLDPTLTVLRAPFESLGLQAIAALEPDAGAAPAPLPYELVRRHSCGC